jgi:hypothetical protein
MRLTDDSNRVAYHLLDFVATRGVTAMRQIGAFMSAAKFYKIRGPTYPQLFYMTGLSKENYFQVLWQTAKFLYRWPFASLRSYPVLVQI